MSSDGARCRSSGGGHSSFDEEQQRRQAGTSPSSSYLFQGGRTGGRRSSFPEEDTVEGRGRRRQSRSKSPGRYHRPHHFGSRDEQSSRPNRSRSQSYDQYASSSRNPHNYYSNRSHDEQLSGSSRSYGRHSNKRVSSDRSRDEQSSEQGRSRNRDRHPSARKSSSGGGSSGLDHEHSTAGQRYRPQASPCGPPALHGGHGHVHRSTPYASAGTTSASAVSSSQRTASATLARLASAPTRHNLHDPLVSLQRNGVRTDMMASMGVDANSRLLRLMINVSLICLFTSYCVASNVVSSHHCACALLSSKSSNVHVRLALLFLLHRSVIPR